MEVSITVMYTFWTPSISGGRSLKLEENNVQLEGEHTLHAYIETVSIYLEEVMGHEHLTTYGDLTFKTPTKCHGNSYRHPLLA